MPYLKAKSGIEWHYDIEGEGGALLFLHGWGVDKRIWRQQSKYFSTLYTVVTVDLPGHGDSSWEKIPLEGMAADLKLLLLAQNIKELMIVGSSVGGLLGLQLFDFWPEAIKKMSFCGSLPKFSKSEDFPYGLDVGQIRKLSGQLRIAYPSIVNIFFRSLFTKEERESRRFKWLQKFRQMDVVPMREALSDYLEILEAVDLRETLKKIKIPLQFINGTEDDICNRASVDFLKKNAPHARFDDFNKCGHFPFLSKPHEFNAILESFLKS